VIEEDIWVKRDEGTGDWKVLHNNELRDVYSSLYIIWVIESKRVR
jgi:hypothetical protein